MRSMQNKEGKHGRQIRKEKKNLRVDGERTGVRGEKEERSRAEVKVCKMK